LFFSANVSSSQQNGFTNQQHGFTWTLISSSLSIGKFIYIYILFCLVEFIPFVIMTKDTAHRALLIIASVTLVLLPFYKYGEYNDLAMRASIPALLILYLLVVKKINEHFSTPASFEKSVYSAILIVILLFSAVTPLHNILQSRDMVESGYPSFTDDWRTFDKVRSDPGKRIATSYFVVGNPTEMPFFKAIGK
jgi:hypothetical protein